MAKAIYEKPRPKRLGKSKPLTSSQKSKAKAMASKGNRPYPNMVDNIRASKMEDGGEIPTMDARDRMQLYKDGGKVEKDEESYATTFRRGLENNRVTKENPYGPFVFGGVTNVVKRLAGMDYDKDEPEPK